MNYQLAHLMNFIITEIGSTMELGCSKRHGAKTGSLPLGRLFGLAMFALLATAQINEVNANPLAAFNQLTNAPTDDELPAQSAGSAASVNRTLRPALSYPTLHVEERGPRGPLVSDSAPLRATQLSAGAQSDFSALVEESLGTPLIRYGRDLFHPETQNFNAADQINVPGDFVLGPGDEIYLRAWGTVEINYRGAVDRQGQIVLPKVGAVPLAGVRFASLKEHLNQAIGRLYKGFEISVSLGQLKSVQIYVTGFAASPGRYTIPSLSNSLNAILVAGGPAAAGDLRRIVLRRGGSDLAEFDLYDLLIDGQLKSDERLQPNDVLYIPPQLGEIAIAGSVNAPAIFQLKSGETLGELIRYAGGLSTTAQSQQVSLERITASGQRVLETHLLDEDIMTLALRAGDLALVTPINPRMTNTVTLRGHVAQPFRHAFKTGMRISDLIPSLDALISPNYWIEHNRRDQWLGSAKRQTSTNFDQSSPDVNWEYAALERINAETLAVELLPVQLGRAVLDKDPTFDLELQAGDALTVFAINDFRTRDAQKHRFVRIEGEVARAGVYSLGANETLADLIRRAGGVTPSAYLFGLELRRESVRRRQEARIDEAIDELERDYQRHLIDRSRNVLSGDLSMAIPPESDAIANLIYRLREARPSGRMVLELEPNIDNPNSLPMFALDDGDSIYVPPRPDTVEVVGAVIRQGSFLHTHQRRFDSYVEKAGPIPGADQRNIYVLRADGTFVKATKKLWLAAGDAIVVPEKVDRATFVRRLKDWTQVLYQFGLGAAGLKILDGL